MKEYCFCHTRAPSWILSQAENLASSILQDGAMEWHYSYHIPPTHPPYQQLMFRQQYLSCYWPDLDQTLNKGSWEHIQQIRTVTSTFVQATFVLGTLVHISNISAVTDPILMKL